MAQPQPRATHSGVVVEEVTKNSEATRADIREADILLSWSRNDAKGEIKSPLDLTWLELEQSPRGAVTLEGLRGAEKKTWTLGPDDWGIQARPDFSESLLQLYREGQELAQAGKAIEAAERWRAGKADAVDSSAFRLWLAFHSAELLSKARQWSQADEAYHQCLEPEASIGSPHIREILILFWARSYERRSDWANAEKYYQRVASQESAGENLIAALAFNQLAQVAWFRGDITMAEHNGLHALEIQKKLAPNSLLVATTLSQLAYSFRDRDRPAEAEKYLLQAIATGEKVAPDSLYVSNAFANLAGVEYVLGNLEKAEAFYVRALEIRNKMDPGKLDVAEGFNFLGNMARDRGELAKSEVYYRQAREVMEKPAPEDFNVASGLNDIAVTAWQRGDLAHAEKCLRKAIEIDKKVAPASRFVAFSLHNLGYVYQQRGDLAAAEQCHRQSLALRKQLVPDSLHVANCVSGLGAVLRDRGELAGAADSYQQALEIEQKLDPGSLLVAETLDQLGELAQEREDLKGAREYLDRAYAIQKKLNPGGLDASESLNHLGEMARLRGELDEAEQYHREALAIREKLASGTLNHAESLVGLAKVMQQKQQPEAAARLFEQALDALESQTARLGGLDETRSNFRARHTSYYEEYLELLISLKKPETAFHVSERSRARSLLETLAAAHVHVRKGIDPELLKQERFLQQRINTQSSRRIQAVAGQHTEGQVTSLNKQIEDLLAQYKDVEEQIRLHNPDYAALTQPQPLSAKEIQTQLLDPDTSLLEYSLGEKRSYVFALTTDSLSVYELPKRSAIEELARHVHKLLGTKSRPIAGETGKARQDRMEADSEYRKSVAALSQMILEPVTGELKGKRILVVADGALQYVPFAALPVPNMALRNATDEVLLVAEHEVINLPSASVLAILRRETVRSAHPKTVAVLADPVFDSRDARVKGAHKSSGKPAAAHKAEVLQPMLSEDSLTREQLTRSMADVGFESSGEYPLRRLAFSRREAKAILSVIPAAQGMEALDFKASRATATSPELSQYQIIHFATHGLLDNEHPELSGLVLSLVNEQGRPQNGFLQLQDIYNLNLSSDMVVLSACETGLGKEIKSEGLLGLTRGFMYAGARRVVASLWSVDDAATAELMARFYKAMEKDDMRPPAALRQAQIEMSRQERWKDPYYWAGFIIQGEWK